MTAAILGHFRFAISGLRISSWECLDKDSNVGKAHLKTFVPSTQKKGRRHLLSHVTILIEAVSPKIMVLVQVSGFPLVHRTRCCRKTDVGGQAPTWPLGCPDKAQRVFKWLSARLQAERVLSHKMDIWYPAVDDR